MFDYSKLPYVDQEGWFDTVRWHVSDVIAAFNEAEIEVTQSILEQFFMSRAPKTLHEMCVQGGNEALYHLVTEEFAPDEEDDSCPCGSGKKILGHTPLGKAVCDDCLPKDDELFCSVCGNAYPEDSECFNCPPQ